MPCTKRGRPAYCLIRRERDYSYLEALKKLLESRDQKIHFDSRRLKDRTGRPHHTSVASCEKAVQMALAHPLYGLDREARITLFAFRQSA